MVGRSGTLLSNQIIYTSIQITVQAFALITFSFLRVQRYMDKFICHKCKTVFVQCEECYCILNNALDNHDCPAIEQVDEGIEAEPPYFPCVNCYLLKLLE